MTGSDNVKHPCIGCVYFAACGKGGRTVPCDGRLTKSERRKLNEKNKKVGAKMLFLQKDADRRG